MTSSRRRRSRRARAARRVSRRAARAPVQSSRLSPWRIAAVVALWIWLAVLVDGAFDAADLPGALALVGLTLVCAKETPRAIGLLRGTISHETIIDAPSQAFLSLSRFRAFTPCLIIALDGLLVGLALHVFDGAEDGLSRVVADAGLAVFFTFLLAGYWVALVRRPRLLLPKTMRHKPRR